MEQYAEIGEADPIIFTTNKRKIRVENPRGRSPRGFSTRIFLEFGVNIIGSAEQSSEYCHYSSFFGCHKHSIFTPRGENSISSQYSPLGVNMGKYSTLSFSTVAPKNME